MIIKVPRLVIAGLSGDSGKTVTTLSILAALKAKAASISVFKKGPDYIDAAWLQGISGSVCRNLDTYLVDSSEILGSFGRGADGSDICLIEGNRGLFDGKDDQGTHSTAQLARLLKAPVILVINCTKATRTIAALVKGCMIFEPGLNIAGVILNKVAGDRHKNIISDSIEGSCGIPVLGAIPKLGNDASLLPGRHLGLTPPSEFGDIHSLKERLNKIAGQYLDIENLMEKAYKASPLMVPDFENDRTEESIVKIGYFCDSVFTFYYPENLEALQANGAELVPISSLDDRLLPEIDALYIGGGFPEISAERLAKNRTLLDSVKSASDSGMPIYAECGGLIYLSKSIAWGANRFKMANVFPFELRMSQKPAGHGYVSAVVDTPNPFFDKGFTFKGHEFHYSEIIADHDQPAGCIKIISGTGLGNMRDGLMYKNTLACYTHIHATGVKQWATSMVKNAGEFKKQREGKTGPNFNSSNWRNTVAA